MTYLLNQPSCPLFNFKKVFTVYNVTKLSADTNSFLLNLPLYSKGNQELTALAAARAISNDLTLPSSPVESAAAFYVQAVYNNARDMISDLNEVTVVDLNRVQELVKTFWLVRYNILFPRKKLFCTNALVSESHFLGFGSILGHAESAMIQQSSEVLINLYNGFSQLLTELSPQIIQETAEV